MTMIIKLIGDARHNNRPSKTMWYKDGDFEAINGYGYFTFTENKGEAKRFSGWEEAVNYIHTIPENRKKRIDGGPNRPLLAYHLSVCDLWCD